MSPIIRLAARGDGVTDDGRFVAGAVPGDSLAEDGSMTHGPNRIAPVCRHFGRCGGCQLQHVNDVIYADYLTDRIAESLKAQGLPLPEIARPHLSPPETRRRAALIAEKKGKQLILGFSEPQSHRIVDLNECPVMHPALAGLIKPLRDLLRDLLPQRKRGQVRMTLADQGVDLMLGGVEADGLAGADALSGFAQTHRLARLSVDEGYGPTPRWEPDPATVTLGGVAVPLPEGAFLQATADGEAALVASVKDALTGAVQVADLFAGLGSFALALDGKVHAAEGARDAILSLAQAANRAKRALSTEHRDLFRRPLTVKELERFDGVVIDPPRAGAKEQAGELARSGVPRIAFISCNPATFARDARILVDGGYALIWIRPVGQFRWSTHVELAACFTRG